MVTANNMRVSLGLHLVAAVLLAQLLTQPVSTAEGMLLMLCHEGPREGGREAAAGWRVKRTSSREATAPLVGAGADRGEDAGSTDTATGGGGCRRRVCTSEEVPARRAQCTR